MQGGGGRGPMRRATRRVRGSDWRRDTADKAERGAGDVKEGDGSARRRWVREAAVPPGEGEEESRGTPARINAQHGAVR